MATIIVAKLLLCAVVLYVLLHQTQATKPTVGFTAASSSVSEKTGSVTISLERTVQTNISTTLTIEVSSDSTATKNDDYTIASEPLVVTFPKDDKTTKSFDLTIVNDDVAENSETVILKIREDTAAFDIKAGLSSHTISIADDDATIPTIGFTAASSSVSETTGLVTISLERNFKRDIPTTVTIELSDGNATKDSDYVASGSLVVAFPKNDEEKKNVYLFIVNDQDVETLENVFLKIKEDSAAFNIKTGLSSHTIFIADDDVSISCQNTQVTESAGTATVNIARSGSPQALNAAHSIGCITEDDTAVAPDDYTITNSAIEFPSHSQTQQMDIVIKNDVHPEGNDTFKVRCYTNDVRVKIKRSCQDAVVTIENDDIYTFFCPNGHAAQVKENIGNFEVDICRKGVLSSSPSIQLCRTSEGGISPSVREGCSDVVFAAYSDRTTATFAITDDDVGEKELQTFHIYLNISDNAITSTDTNRHNVTIQDNDNTFYMRNIRKITMTEGALMVDVNVTIDRQGEISAASNVSLQLVFNATAESADCTGSSPRVIQFDGGVTSRTVTACTVVDDRLVEEDETFNVTISGVGSSNVRTGKSERTVKLISNDVNVACEGASVKEADGPAIVRLDRTGATGLDAIEILCSTTDGTAFSTTDYQSQALTAVPFAVYYTTKPFRVVVRNDNVPEGNETFTVTCTTSDPRVVVDPSCSGIQINIINDDTYVYFCPGYSTSIEENVGSYTIRLCRVGVLEDTHTVRLCRTADAASLPLDYPSVQAECNDIVFTAYDEVKQLVVNVTDDTWGEQEYKIFNISMSTTDPGVTFNDTTSYAVTIHDDDNTFYLMDVNELQKTEGVGSADVNLTINRVGRTSVASNVSLQLVFTGAAADSTDCTGSSPRVIQFDGGVTSRTITACTVVDDRLVEEDETFNVTISGVGTSNVRNGKSERVIRLISNDVNIRCQGVSVKEADGPAIVRLDRTGATAITANDIRCSTASGNALSLIDYQSKTLSTVSFSLNDKTKNFSVLLKNDRVVEGNETFTVICSTSDPRVVVDPSCGGIQINIINDDTYVYFCPGYSTSIEENVGSYTVRLCRVGVLEDTHTVRLCRTSDAVSLPHDYPSVQAQCNDIVFRAYDEVKELVIPVINDTWGEQEYKTFNISMNTTDPGVTFNDTTSYVVTIHDDDNTFCFTRTSTTVYEEHDEFVNLTIRRTGEILMSSASVIIKTLPQTAVTPEDYTEPILNQSLTFFTREVEKNISVNIVNDKLVEEDETFQLSLTGVDGSTVFSDCTNSTVTIVSNDVNIFCRDRRGPQSVYENKSPVLVEFTREGSLQYNHTIRIRTINGTALSGDDYTAIDKTVTFAPNQTSINETVVLNDNVVEPDEAFRLSVTSSDDRVNMICPGTDFTILNDDTFIRCTKQSIEVSEGNKTVYFTLKREGVLNKSSPIWFSTKDGTAFDKSDYEPQNIVNKTFLPGQVYMTLNVDLVDDEFKEDTENFSIIIGSYVPTTLTSGDKCEVINIKDDDPYRITKQQAQALLVKKQNVEILLAAAVAIIGVVLFFVVCLSCYFFRLGK